MGGTDGAEGATNLELNPDLWVVSAAGGLSDLPKRRLLDPLLVTGRGGGDIYTRMEGGGGFPKCSAGMWSLVVGIDAAWFTIKTSGLESFFSAF